MTDHKVVSREEWLAARKELLKREKEHTRLGDELARRRRELPWVPVEKEYSFETDDGTKTFAELFDGRSQLLVYHFMFGPSYNAGCPTCSSIADSLNGAVPHLRARDATMVCVSHAPLEQFLAGREPLLAAYHLVIGHAHLLWSARAMLGWCAYGRRATSILPESTTGILDASPIVWTRSLQAGVAPALVGAHHRATGCCSHI